MYTMYVVTFYAIYYEKMSSYTTGPVGGVGVRTADFTTIYTSQYVVSSHILRYLLWDNVLIHCV